MRERPIPIKQGGKVVGYVNPPLRFRLWYSVKRLLGRLLQRARKNR
jgi:hypothetical protein